MSLRSVPRVAVAAPELGDVPEDLLRDRGGVARAAEGRAALGLAREAASRNWSSSGQRNQREKVFRRKGGVRKHRCVSEWRRGAGRARDLSDDRARAVRPGRDERGRLGRGLGFALLGEEHGVDVREHAAGRDRDRAEELVELLVVADRELDVARDDARLLVVARGVARELEDLGAEVLEDGAHVDTGTDADARGVLALAEVAVEARHRELEASLGRRGRRAGGLGLALAAATFSFARHDVRGVFFFRSVGAVEEEGSPLRFRSASAPLFFGDQPVCDPRY